jgi:3-deoxy-7-phosphoheptulonate synthase
VAATCDKLEKVSLRPNLMIDCSHANSNKDHTRQAGVCRSVASQVAGGDRRIIGLMLESNLVAGSQKLVQGKLLTHGQSITDGCMGWEETEKLLSELSDAVHARRG